MSAHLNSQIQLLTTLFVCSLQIQTMPPTLTAQVPTTTKNMTVKTKENLIYKLIISQCMCVPGFSRTEEYRRFVQVVPALMCWLGFFYFLNLEPYRKSNTNTICMRWTFVPLSHPLPFIDIYIYLYVLCQHRTQVLVEFVMVSSWSKDNSCVRCQL